MYTLAFKILVLFRRVAKCSCIVLYCRKFHSTESAVLKVLSDIYAAADEKMVTLLGQLDLSAAFDTVDHQILFDRLRYEYGLDGFVLVSSNP